MTLSGLETRDSKKQEKQFAAPLSLIWLPGTGNTCAHRAHGSSILCVPLCIAGFSLPYFFSPVPWVLWLVYAKEIMHLAIEVTHFESVTFLLILRPKLYSSLIDKENKTTVKNRVGTQAVQCGGGMRSLWFKDKE